MKKLLIPITLLGLLFIFGCSKATDKPVVEENGSDAESAEESAESSKPAVDTAFEYSNKKYGFSVGFPENWGTVKENGGEAETAVSNVVADFHWVAEDDDDRYFNLFIVNLEGHETQGDLGQTLLTTSDEYAFYYTATQPDPVVCADDFSATADEQAQCDADRAVWEDEIQAVVVASFWLTSL